MKKRDIHRAEPRHDTLKSHYIQPHRHDPYKARQKLDEPTECPSCGALFREGRWQWATDVPKEAHRETCPACHRINDKYPAGELTLSGRFLSEHQDEIVRLIRNTERAEKQEHPLQRIMAIEAGDAKIVVTTTDIHLARRIGHAIEDAFKGDLKTHYNEEEYFVRLTWRRDA
ncbi:MAG TPA: BCAM0308 family protein [Methyloceanibacter sp.]|nr:BCAM0308 family protein [Methyloceanibacter sp.]